MASQETPKESTAHMVVEKKDLIGNSAGVRQPSMSQSSPSKQEANMAAGRPDPKNPAANKK